MSENFTKSYDHVMRDGTKSLLARLIYCRILRFTENKKQAFTTQQWLAEEFGASSQQVYRAIKELKDSGLINSHQRGLSQSNLYTTNEWPMDANIEALAKRKARNEVITDDEPESSNLMSLNLAGDDSGIVKNDEHKRQGVIDNLNDRRFSKEEDTGSEITESITSLDLDSTVSPLLPCTEFKQWADLIAKAPELTGLTSGELCRIADFPNKQIKTDKHLIRWQ